MTLELCYLHAAVKVMPGSRAALKFCVLLVAYTTLASRFGLLDVLSATAAIQLNSSVIARIRALLTGEATLSTPREPCDKPTAPAAERSVVRPPRRSRDDQTRRTENVAAAHNSHSDA